MLLLVALGALFGCSWAAVVRFRAALERLWGALGLLLGALGALLAVLGPLLGCSWPLLSYLGASGGDFESFGAGYFVDLGLIWGGFGVDLGRFAVFLLVFCW